MPLLSQAEAFYFGRQEALADTLSNVEALLEGALRDGGLDAAPSDPIDADMHSGSVRLLYMALRLARAALKENDEARAPGCVA